MRNTPEALILLSGGLDSAYNLAAAAKKYVLVEALFLDYGQRASKQELRAARALSAHFHVPLREINLPWLGALGTNALTDLARDLPKVSGSELDDAERTQISMEAVWVPNRNGVFLSVAAAVAEALGIAKIVVGFNAEEASTFPDNSLDYVNAINQSFRYSTRTPVQVESFSVALQKSQIVSRGRAIGLPFDLLWSCYESGDIPCGECESCSRLQRALKSEESLESNDTH